MIVEQKLPSESDLEALFNQKGRAALVWYAWRASLRALPFIAEQPLISTWSMQTVGHCYAMARVNILLSQYGGTLSVHASDASTSIYVTTYAASGAASAAAHASASISSVSEAAVSAAAASVVSAASTASSYLYSAADAASASVSAASASQNAAASTDLEAILSANIVDYHWLVSSDKACLKTSWVNRPLWGEGVPSEHWLNLQSKLLKFLKGLDLDFLANDLFDIWQGRLVGAHFERYFRDLSLTITNDAEKLRQVILGEVATTENHAVRLLLVGPGGAGKSSLANLLLGNAQVQEQQATVGITLTPFALFSEYFSDVPETDEQLAFSLWDFGGQAIFHGLHQTFMHENCVYILVVDSRHEQAPDTWLHQIRGAAENNNPKVLLVTNQYESCYARRNETRLLRLFPELLESDSFCYFPCNQDSDGYQAFTRSLIKAASESKKSILEPTARVMQALREDFEQADNKNPELFIDKDDLKESYPEFDDGMLDDLVQLGHIVGSKDDDLCVNPNLVTKYGYQVLNDPSVGESNGFVAFNTIKNITFKEDPLKIIKDDRKRLVEFLKDKKLACESNGQYFFPDAATSNEPAVVNAHLSQAQTFTLLFDMAYMPHGLHTQLVSALFNNADVSIKAVEDVWRHGFILEKSSTKVKAIVQYTFAKSMVEVTLLGEPVKEYADVISTFTNALSQVHPSVNTYWVSCGKSLAIDVNSDFIKVLGGVAGYSELIDKAESMAKESVHIHGDNNQVNTGDGAELHKDAHNSTTLIQNDLDTLGLVMQALNEKAQDDAKLKVAVEQVQNALSAPATPENKSLLTKVWSGLKGVGEVVGTIDNLTKAGSFVTLYLPAITAVLNQAM